MLNKIQGDVQSGGSATFLARIAFDAVVATQANIATITCAIYDRNGNTPTTAVATPTITVAGTVFDTLQTDARWTADQTGYNFKFLADPTTFANAQHRYDVIFKFTSSTGQICFAEFEVKTHVTTY